MEIQNRNYMYAYTYISLCAYARAHVYTFYETEMIPVVEAWGDDLVRQQCQNHWIHPFQQQAEREDNSYFMLKDTVTATISKMCFNS